MSNGVQQVVRYDYGFGVPGEWRKAGGGRRTKPGFIVSGSAANNIVGSAFTQAAAGGVVSAGGTGIFAGILCGPKQYASYGSNAGGPLGPTITLPNNTQGEFAQSGDGLVVVMQNANVGIGDYVYFTNATGLLSSAPAGTAVPANCTQILGAVVDDLPQPTAGGLCAISLMGPQPGTP
jgi:hypothetical protein